MGMSTAGRERRRFFAAVLAGSALSVLLGSLLARVLIGPAPTPAVRRPDGFYGRTSLNTGALGTLAWYQLLQAEGIPVRRRAEPLELFTPPGRPLLVLAGPTQALTPSEVRWILRYVAEEGGAVLLVPYAAQEGELQPAAEATELLDGIGLELDAQSQVADLKGTPIEEAVPVLELLPPTPPARIAIRGGSRLRWKDEVPEGARVLAEDDQGLAAVTVPLGPGTFIVLADLFPLTNRGLGRLDDAPFAAALALEFAGPGGVLVDEYHHGINRSRGVIRMLAWTPLGWVAVQCIVVAALWLYAGGLRFGTPRASVETARRGALEQVEALADLYDRARAHRLVGRLLWRRFVSRAWREMGLRAPRPGDELKLARAVADLLGEPPESVLHLAREALTEPLTLAELVRLDRRLHLLTRRIEDVARASHARGAHPVPWSVPGGGRPARGA
jgi:hypothetical protein